VLACLPCGAVQLFTLVPCIQVVVEYDIHVYQPLNFNADEVKQALIVIGCELMFVAAYVFILPPSILDAPRLGCINIHASILPRWRGAAPFQGSILAGDAETGITIMQMDVGLDTGDMLSKVTCEIDNEMTASQLHDQLMEMGGKALMDIMPVIENERLQPEKQDESLVTYAEKLQKAEATIDWKQSATQIALQIRAFNAWPVSQTLYFKGDKELAMRIWQAQPLSQSTDADPGKVIAVQKKSFHVATGDGVLEVTEIQMPGKKPMAVAAFLNANDPLVNITGDNRQTNVRK